jgi:FKBP-type peptidyl-prolyl cis-trans isomerase FkpA
MNQFLQRTLTAAVAVGLALPLSASALDKLTTEKEKVSYMVGMDLANGIGQIKDEVDINLVIEAMKTQLAGGKSLMTAEESQAVRQSFMQKLQAAQQAKTAELAGKNKAEGDKYLATNKAKAGVKTTASGLQYSVIKEGTGKKPTAESTVKVHYTGTLIDGTKFDSSVDRGEPAQFPLNGVIAGWTEGLQLMTVGSKYKFVIPSNLAYGDKPSPGPIGPNSTLIFDVELIEIVN